MRWRDEKKPADVSGAPKGVGRGFGWWRRPPPGRGIEKERGKKKDQKGKDCGPAENSNVNDSSNRADAATSLDIRGSPTSLPLFLFFSLSLSLLSSFFRLFDVSFFLPFSFSSSSLLIELPVGGDRRGPGVDWPDVFLFGPSGEGRRYDGLLGFYWCTSPRSLRIGISVLRSLREVELDDLSSTFKDFSHDTS